MIRALDLIVTLVTTSMILIPKMAYSQSITDNSNSPLVSSLYNEDLVCYMQTANGTTLDLSNLCSQESKSKSEVVISHVDYEDNFLIGHVVNKSSKTVYRARVNIEVVGEDGNVISRGAISTEPANLNPGQTAIFQSFMPNNSNDVRATFVEWDE